MSDYLACADYVGIMKKKCRAFAWELTWHLLLLCTTYPRYINQPKTLSGEVT
jgi:hypothetical protein